MNRVSLVSSLHKQGRNKIQTRGSADNLNTQKGCDPLWTGKATNLSQFLHWD